MQHNMNFVDIVIRYTILMIIVIIGGLFNSIALMLLGLPFFFAAISGWCPLFAALGINHHKGAMLIDPNHKEEH